MQVCTSGDSVTGVFLWTSLESGWDRRTFIGQWLDARQRLVLHDTAMLENHPANGWRLCLADRYDLHRVSETELNGEFWSQACSDHGTLRITRISQSAMPAELSAPPPPPPSGTQRRAEAPTRRRVLGCAATPRSAAATGSGLGWVLLALGALSRSRCSRARR